MTTTDQKKFAISEFLAITAVAACDACNKRDELLVADVDEAADGFYSLGWRATKDERLLCPKCRRKR